MKKITSRMNQSKVWLAILLLALTLPSRVINIDRAINIDEPWWVISGANFYRAFNLRAPGMLSLKSYLFNVERK